MTNQMLLAALSQDLYRIAMSYHRGSFSTGRLFTQNVLESLAGIEKKSLKPYLKSILTKLPKVLSQKNKNYLAEDALTYSLLLQNAAFYKQVI